MTIITSSGSIADLANSNTGNDDSIFDGSAFPDNPVLHTVSAIVRGAVVPSFGIIRLAHISLALNKLDAFSASGLACPTDRIMTDAYHSTIVSAALGVLTIPQFDAGGTFTVTGSVATGGPFITWDPASTNVPLRTGDYEMLFPIVDPYFYRALGSGGAVVLQEYTSISPPSPGSLPPGTTHVDFSANAPCRKTRITTTTYTSQVTLDSEGDLIDDIVKPAFGYPADVPLLDTDFEYSPGTTSTVESLDPVVQTEVRDGTANSSFLMSLADYTSSYPQDPDDYLSFNFGSFFDSFGTLTSDSTDGSPPGDMTPDVDVAYTATWPHIVALDSSAMAAISGSDYAPLGILSAPYNCTL